MLLYRRLAVSLVLLASMGVLPEIAEAQGSPELAGGWIVTSWTSPDGVTNAEPQRGLFIFTAAGQYSMMYVNTDEPRPRYEGETQTEAETLAAYASFTANSGRYRVEGNKLTYEAYMAKDPNYMADFGTEDGGNAVHVEFSITDGILTLKWLDGFTPGTTATFRRPRAN